MVKKKATEKTSPIKSYMRYGKEHFKFQVYLGIDPLTGDEIRTTRSGFTTKKEAKQSLNALKTAFANGTYKKERAETYQELYNLWIIQYEKTVEESTFEKTKRIFKNHVLPAMGAYKIEKINVEICQKHVDDWSTKLVNFRMVKSYAAKVIDFAIKRGYLQNNPFSLIEMPNPKKKKSPDNTEEIENFYTKEQLTTFLKCLEIESDFKAYTFFRLLAFSGMRKGEVFALTWKDINFENNEIKVNKALSRVKNSRLYVKSTKTGDTRLLKMDDKTMAILMEWKKKQRQDYLVLGINTVQLDQLVFSNLKNEFLQPTKSREWLKKIQVKYNLPEITTHGLRHTHCSLLFEAGATLKEVQDRLGHSDAHTTMNIYAHVSKKAQEEAIQKFENYLSI